MEKDILLVLVGILMGGMNAIAGGGALIGFPVLLSLGLSALVADATTFVAVLPGQIASAIGYRNYLKRVHKVYLLLLIPCIIGASIGAYLLRHTSVSNFEKVVPLLILFAVALFAAQPLLRHHFVHHLRSKHKNWWKFVVFAVALLVMTIYGGYFGAGLGFATLALISFSDIHEIHTMNGLKNLVGITVMTIAIMNVASAHLIHWQFGLFMAGGNLIGGYAGSRLTQKVSTHLLRLIVIAIGITTVIYLLFKFH